MKRIRRYLSILLVLALLLTCVPASVLAAEEHRHISGYNDRYGAGGRVDCPITESPEVVDRPDFSEFPTSFEEAGDVLRAGFVARQEVIQVCIATPEEDIEVAFYEIWDEAMAHTGNPVEGDYIYGQWDYYYVEYESEWFEDKWYHAYAVVMEYYTDAQMEAEVDAAVDTLLNETLPLDDSMSDYEKVKIVYDWICSNVGYDDENVDDETYLPQYTAHAALLDGVAVCNGYAVLLYRLLLELGIDCRMITGDAGGPHAWNIVALDGLYYNVDATWDADWAILEQPYEWFLLSPDSFVDHEREYEYDTADFHAAYPMAAADYPGYDRPDPDPTRMTGQCGDDLYWSLESNGLLAITGTGAMWDYPEEYPGWYSYRDILTKVVIHAGVTTIGDFAFYECSGVEQVTIHSSVSRIGQSAFFGCNLTELTIPSGVKEIESAAFKANLMTSVTIPASVEIIGDYAFADCDLTEIRFMGAAPAIADDAFEEVTAACYYPSHYSWSNDMLRNYGGRLTWIPDNADLTGQCGDDVYWCLDGNGLLTISGTGPMWDFDSESGGPWAASGRTVTDVILEPGVTSIGRRAFAGLDALRTAQLPEGLLSIGEFAFDNCTALTEVNISESVSIIGMYAFLKCESLTSLTIPAGVRQMGAMVFHSCDGLKEITFQGDAPALGNEVFRFIETTVYYPGDNDTWTEEVRQDYGGTVTWMPVGGAAQTEDLNGDGSVDSDDAVYLLYHTLFGDGLYPVAGDCDFNADGSVDADDAIYLLFYVLFGELLYPMH